MFIGSCFTLLGDCSSNISMCFGHICSTLMFKSDVINARATIVYTFSLRLLLKWLLCDAVTSMTLWFCYIFGGTSCKSSQKSTCLLLRFIVAIVSHL